MNNIHNNSLPLCGSESSSAVCFFFPAMGTGTLYGPGQSGLIIKGKEGKIPAPCGAAGKISAILHPTQNCCGFHAAAMAFPF